MTSSGWPTTTLGSFVSLQRGHDLPESRRCPGTVPVAGSFGITGYHNEGRAPGPGVTVGRSGGSIGVVTFLPSDYWPLNTVLYVTDFHGNDPRFAYYLLQTLNFERFNSGSAQPSLNRNYISGIRIRVPRVREQRPIAALLGSLDDRIQLNRRVARTAQELVQAVFAQSIHNAPLTPLSNLSTISREGVTPAEYPEVVYDHFSIPAFDAGEVPARESGVEIRSGKYVVSGGSVLLSKLNPRISRVWLPDLRGRPAICSTEFLVVEPQTPFTREYLYALFLSRSFRDELTGRVTGTSGSHQRVKPADVLTIPVPIADEEARSRFQAVAEPLLVRAALGRRESGTLAELRDTLLPKLISGEVRLKDVPAA
jgi:type I restriction enzyme S subunit